MPNSRRTFWIPKHRTMHWVLMNKLTAAIQEFHLESNQGLQLVVKYNPLHRSVRLVAPHVQRLFFLESAGSLHGKLRFLNEYGFESGEASYDAGMSQSGYVRVDGKKFHYDLQLAEPESMCILWDATHTHKIGSCRIPAQLDTQEHPLDWACLIFSACWMLSLPQYAQSELVKA